MAAAAQITSKAVRDGCGRQKHIKIKLNHTAGTRGVQHTSPPTGGGGASDAACAPASPYDTMSDDVECASIAALIAPSTPPLAICACDSSSVAISRIAYRPCCAAGGGGRVCARIKSNRIYHNQIKSNQIKSQ